MVLEFISAYSALPSTPRSGMMTLNIISKGTFFDIATVLDSVPILPQDSTVLQERMTSPVRIKILMYILDLSTCFLQKKSYRFITLPVVYKA